MQRILQITRILSVDSCLSFILLKIKPSVVKVIIFLSLHFFKKPKCEFPTILDMLEIKDAVIANCLIDQVMNV